MVAYSISCTHKHVSGVLWEVYCMKPATKVIELVTQVTFFFFSFYLHCDLQSESISVSLRKSSHPQQRQLSINASVDLESSYIYFVPFTIPVSLYIRVKILQLYFFPLLLMPEGSVPNKPFLDLSALPCTDCNFLICPTCRFLFSIFPEVEKMRRPL